MARPLLGFYTPIMDRTAGQKRPDATLYPAIDPFDRRLMDTGDGHQIYVEQSGTPEGQPVVVLHGGPGGGTSPFMRRYFDPSRYRIILFDQRGCGKSTPHASTSNNTTWHLVRDIEMIRDALKITQWMVFGGSWGATLALAYAQTHPAAVSHLILRGVFLGERGELDWFYGGGAARFYPDLWAEFCKAIPEDERDDLIEAYGKRLFSGHYATEAKYGQRWAAWENALASASATPMPTMAPASYARAFARLENHYFRNNCFLQEGQILRDRHLIEHIPVEIVQGRLDMICPPGAAKRLADGWLNARLQFITGAGHALSEPGISASLISIMNRLA